MTTSAFNEIVNEQLNYCMQLLGVKNQEYSPDEGDRLHTFEVAAVLQGCSKKEALAGMMAKHSVSVYDMCQGDHIYPKDKWIEKITDSINYLLLLRAMIEEET